MNQATRQAGPSSTGSGPAPAISSQQQSGVAIHPSGRWETAFVYAFVSKFTGLRKKVEGFETPMDFEQALMFSGRDPIIEAILSVFLVNLRPSIRNPQQKTERLVTSVVEEYCKNPTERSIWWDEETRRNKDPLTGTKGFFSLSWDTKLTILRQLVEWQVTHCVHIRETIDTAWGVKASKHTKKADKEANAPPPPEDPRSLENLRMVPLGQDSTRKRYWIVDDSPRIYMSSNPWKSLCPFTAISNSLEEFQAVIENLKRTASTFSDRTASQKPSRARPNKNEQSHLELISKLEVEQLPKVEAEVARVAKARKRLEQKTILLAQTDIRATRTRRQARRPDYVYDFEDPEDNDDNDDYKYVEDMDDFIDDGDLDDEAPSGSHRRRARNSNLSPFIEPRRSSRAAVLNSRKRPADTSLLDPATGLEWRGERRSSRLGNAPPIAFDDDDLPPAKRAKSSLGGSSVPPDDSPAGSGSGPGPSAPPIVDAAPLVGKKKSKFWYYTVEPIPGASTANADAEGSSDLSSASSFTAGPSRGPNGYGSAVEGPAVNGNGRDHSHAPGFEKISVSSAAPSVSGTGSTAVDAAVAGMSLEPENDSGTALKDLVVGTSQRGRESRHTSRAGSEGSSMSLSSDDG